MQAKFYGMLDGNELARQSNWALRRNKDEEGGIKRSNG